MLDGLIVLEQELRGPAEMELPVEPGLNEARGAVQGGEGRLALLLAAVDAQPDGGLRQIRRRVDPVTVTKPTRGSFSVGSSPRRLP